jgi:hypothetical protein
MGVPMPALPPRPPRKKVQDLVQVRSPALLVLLLSALVPSCTGRGDPEERIVAEVARMYLLADQEGDLRRLQSVLHSRAGAWYLRRDGSLAVVTGPTTRGLSSAERGTMGEGGQSRILAVDVHGTAAMVKAELRLRDGRFTDYLTLLKLEEGWRIVASSSHWEWDVGRVRWGG